MKTIELSIVVPCYCEGKCLEELVKRVVCAAEKTCLTYEFILVDDGSTDDTWEQMQYQYEQNSCIRVVRLMRNHGHQLALTAGLSLVRGKKYVFVIDADLQDPPELLEDMLKTLETENADVVYGKRKKRDGEPIFKLVTASLFYRFLRLMTDVDIPTDTGDFRLMRRRVADIFNQMPEHTRFIRGMVCWIGGKQIPFYYHRECRFAGTTNYTLKKMIRLAIDGIASFSIKPLCVGLKVGFFGLMISMIFTIHACLKYFYWHEVAELSILIALIIFIGSLQIFLLGIVGEYLGRIFLDIQKRPLFLISEILEK